MSSPSGDSRPSQRDVSVEPLEQIREILFGELRRAQDSALERLRARIDALTAALEQERAARTDEARALRAELATRGDALAAELAAQGARLDSSKVERASLAAWFEELARALRAS